MKNNLTFVNITAEKGKKVSGFTTVTPEIQIPVSSDSAYPHGLYKTVPVHLKIHSLCLPLS